MNPSTAWQRASAHLEQWLGVDAGVVAALAQTFLVILVYLGIKRLAKHLVRRQVDDPHHRFRVTRGINLALGILGLLVVAKIWLLGKTNLTTYLGILSAGLAIALKDPVANIAAWILLVWRHPFSVGDRIQIGPHTGDVLSIRMFMFTMLEVGNWVDADQSTGRMIYIPNGQIFKDPCANYTQGFPFVWHEIGVIVTFESDWDKAHRILSEIADEQAGQAAEAVKDMAENMAEEFHITYTHTTPIVWLEVVDIGVKLTLRFLCRVRQRRSTTDRIWRQILAAFAQEPDIDFAYPTQRFYQNPLEGKPGAGGPPAPGGPAAPHPPESPHDH